MEILDLSRVEFEKIHEAFLDAFSEYEVPFNLSREELDYMLVRRGYDSKSSYGILEDGKIVCFILNGIGIWNGVKTAYDTGTGTIKSHQGKGYAKKLFAHTVKNLKENKVNFYLLEVIKTNENAFALYRKSSFKISNHYDYYRFNTSNLFKDEFHSNELISIEEVGGINWKLFQTFWDFQPSWQNSIDAMNRIETSIRCLVAKADDEIAGYVLIEPHTGDIPQLAVAKKHRRKGIGTALLHSLMKFTPQKTLKIINVLESNKPFEYFMQSMHIEKGKGQFEMYLEI